ncbi:MAG: hypothetical protein QXN55_00600 [Candidatus Nitrosotenuis sp.]
MLLKLTALFPVSKNMECVKYTNQSKVMLNVIHYETFKRKQVERDLNQLDKKLTEIIMLELDKMRNNDTDTDEIFGFYIRNSMKKELLLNIVAIQLGYEDLYPPKKQEGL